jgi:IS5 family transposase
MDPKLRCIDELLDDDTLIDGVLDAMRGRFAQSGRRGRYGTPAEVALRLLVLKHLKSWSYEQLEWEVTGNLVTATSAASTAARCLTRRRWFGWGSSSIARC